MLFSKEHLSLKKCLVFSLVCRNGKNGYPARADAALFSFAIKSSIMELLMSFSLFTILITCTETIVLCNVAATGGAHEGKTTSTEGNLSSRKYNRLLPVFFVALHRD